jgi:hypothetical protein
MLAWHFAASRASIRSTRRFLMAALYRYFGALLEE